VSEVFEKNFLLELTDLAASEPDGFRYLLCGAMRVIFDHIIVILKYA
jgi:hypothetical protein